MSTGDSGLPSCPELQGAVRAELGAVPSRRRPAEAEGCPRGRHSLAQAVCPWSVPAAEEPPIRDRWSVGQHGNAREQKVKGTRVHFTPHGNCPRTAASRQPRGTSGVHPARGDAQDAPITIC